MSNYIVLGARGATGSHLVKALLSHPPSTVASVKAVVRDPSTVSKDDWSKDERVDVIAGDVTEESTLDFSNTDTVFFACAGRGYDNAKKVDRDGVFTVAKKCKENEVRRMVLISSGLVDPVANRWSLIRGILNTINTGLFHYKGMMDFKFEGEELLRNSGVSYTIVRPGRLGDGKRDLTKNVPLCGQTNAGWLNGSVVNRETLAYVCVDAAMSEHAKNVTFELGTKVPDQSDSNNIFLGLITDKNRNNGSVTTTCG
jgi:uncharacterized protein YbjT (DUF2867 family)